MTASYYGTAEIKKAGALSNVMGKQEKLHIWNLDSRHRFCLGDVLLWDLCAWHSPSQQSGSLSKVPLLARPVMLLKDFSPGLLPFAIPSALGQARIFHHLIETKATLCCLHYLLNPAGSCWRSVPAPFIPLTALWLARQEEINEGLGQHLPPPKRRIASGLRGPVTECKYWIKAAWALV